MRLHLKQILYVSCGVMVAGAAVFGVGFHLDRSEQQGKVSFIKYLTNITTTQADATITDAIDALKVAEQQGAVSCTNANVKKLQAIALARSTISEIGVVNGSGFLVCSSSGLHYRYIPRSHSIYHEATKLHYAISGDPVRGVTSLILKKDLPGAYGLQAIVSRKALLNNPLHSNLQDSGHVYLSLSNQAQIVDGGNLGEHSHENRSKDILFNSSESEFYPITTTVEITATALPGGKFSNLRIFIYLGGFIFCILTGILAYDLSQRERSLRGAVRTGIKRREFIPFYQPIIDGHTGAISGCEVLMRWRKKDGEIIPPHLFIPELETSGQIGEVTRLLMRTVQEEMGLFQNDNPGFFYSINLTASHFTSKEIIEDVQNIFPDGSSSITPKDLVFEVTERQPLHDMDAARLIIEGLQSIGSKVALDDAGTGHGGLSYIHHLGVDKIKIDKLFVESIGRGGPTTPILDALLTMSRQLKIRVIAEGVETSEQLNYLRNHDVDFLQGFLFAKPMPRNAFIHYYNMYHRELVRMKAPAKKVKKTSYVPTETPAIIEAAQ